MTVATLASSEGFLVATGQMEPADAYSILFAVRRWNVNALKQAQNGFGPRKDVKAAISRLNKNIQSVSAAMDRLEATTH